MRERQLVAVAFVALGGIVLGLTLRIDPGSAWFYPASLAVAAVWTAGAFVAGPVRPGARGPVVLPVAIGLGLAGIFVAGSLVVREIGLFADQLRDLGDHATEGSLPLLVVVTAVTGLAEELFFRGSVYDAFPERAVTISTAAYVLPTLATGNLLLAFSAAVLGTVVALERWRWGGLVAPVLTHLTWSLTMLFALPALV